MDIKMRARRSQVLRTGRQKVQESLKTGRPSGMGRIYCPRRRAQLAEARSFPELQAAPHPANRDWQFLPSRGEMVFVAPGEGGGSGVLVSRPLMGGTSRPVATLDVSRDALENFLVSPDAGRVAYLASGVWKVYDVRVRTVVPNLGNFTSPAEWSADGRYMLFDGGRPMILDTRDAKSWPLQEGAAARINWGGDASWSPDRSFVVLSMASNYEEWRQVTGMTSDVVAKLVRGGR